MALFYLLLGLALTAAGSWAARTGRTAPPAAAPAVEFLPASGSGTAPAPAGGVLRPVCPGHSAAGGLGCRRDGALPARAALGAFQPGCQSDRPLALQASRPVAGQCIYGDPQLLRGCRLSPALYAPPGQSPARADCPSGGTALFRQPGAAADAPGLGDPLAGIAGSAVRRAVAAGGRAPAGSGLCHHPAGPASAHRQRHDPAALGALGALPRAVLPWGWGSGCSFGSAELLRAILEPRLLGAGAGLPPLVLTAALFAGLRLGGALGAMLLPAAVLFLWDLGCQGKLPCSRRRAQTADFPFSGQQKKRPAPHRATPLVFYARTQQQGRTSAQ